MSERDSFDGTRREAAVVGDWDDMGAGVQEHSAAGFEGEGFSQLQTTCAGWLARRVASYRLQPADIDDVLQEAWLKVAKRLSRLRAGLATGRLYAWLNRVLLSKAMKLLRHRARHPAHPLGDVLGTEQEPAVPLQDPADRFDNESLAEQAREVVEGLAREGDENMRIVMLRHVEEWTTEEVAAALDLTPAQVRDRLRRGLRKLRKVLGKAAGLGFRPKP